MATYNGFVGVTQRTAPLKQRVRSSTPIIATMKYTLMQRHAFKPAGIAPRELIVGNRRLRVLSSTNSVTFELDKVYAIYKPRKLPLEYVWKKANPVLNLNN